MKSRWHNHFATIFQKYIHLICCRVFFAIIKQFPDLAYHKMWNTKTRLCINRAKQLRLLLQQDAKKNGTKAEKTFTADNIGIPTSSSVSNSKEGLNQQELETIIRACQIKPDRNYSCYFSKFP